jgi:hypothetical protein
LKARERGTRPVTAGDHEGGAADPQAGGRGRPDGRAPPVSVWVKKEKGKGASWTGGGVSWAARADYTRERGREAGGLGSSAS